MGDSFLGKHNIPWWGNLSWQGYWSQSYAQKWPTREDKICYKMEDILGVLLLLDTEDNLSLRI